VKRPYRLALPAGTKAGAIQWPYPERLSTPPFADYGYQHQVLLMVPVRPPAGLKEGQTQKIGALVRYLVCREVCIPGRKELELSLPFRLMPRRSRAKLLRPAVRGSLDQCHLAGGSRHLERRRVSVESKDRKVGQRA